MLGIVLFLFLLSLLGLGLTWASIRFRVEGNPLTEQINAILPQTQCGQCNYPGCKPYAEAIANDEAAINQCPPGGQAGVNALAELLNIEAPQLNAENGSEKPETEVAVIIEADCIGCTLCIQACPVDAIIGSAKMMHGIIESECTGCELCLPPCPVDCIIMQVPNKKINEWVMPIPAKIPIRKSLVGSH